MTRTNSDSTLSSVRRSIFFISMPFFMLGLLLPVHGKEIGASVVEIWLFFSAFSLMTVILRLLVGWGWIVLGAGTSSLWARDFFRLSHSEAVKA